MRANDQFIVSWMNHQIIDGRCRQIIAQRYPALTSVYGGIGSQISADVQDVLVLGIFLDDIYGFRRKIARNGFPGLAVISGYV